MKKVALYVRVSTEEQKKHGLSVDNQIEALKEYCKEHKYAIVNIYNDAGHSAAKKYNKRPALLQLMQDCEKHKFELVLFTRLDRWFRSVPDYYVVQEVLERNNVHWRTIWEDYETESSEGVFKVNIMLSIAQAEAQRTSEKIKSVMQYKRERGDYVGSAPNGYIKVNNQLEFDMKKYDSIKALFEEYIHTHSITSGVLKAKEYGYTISVQSAYKMFNNPTYCGKAPGGYKAPAYITEEQHKTILSMMKSNPRKPKNKQHTYIFSGLLYCEDCGSRLAGKYTNKKGRQGEYPYKFYICNASSGRRNDCLGSYYAEAKLERYLLEHLEDALATFKYSLKQAQDMSDDKTIKRKISSLKTRLERVGDRYEDGDISKETYKQKREDILFQINELESQLLGPTEVIELPSDWKEVYNSLDDKHKQQFWGKAVNKIIIPTDRTAPPKIIF